jgi:hypothetical protein
MATTPVHPYARRLASLVSIAFLTSLVWLTAAAPTFACSCVQPEPMAAYATADNAVFSGTAGPSDGRGVPVRVGQWFSGPGAAAIVYLSAASFAGESSCGTSAPPAGTEWIWVTFVGERGDLMTGLCNPHGQLGTPEGDALLADATKTFGGVALPGVIATDPPDVAPETPAETPPVRTELGGAIVLGTVGLAGALLLGVVLFARRRVDTDA